MILQLGLAASVMAVMAGAGGDILSPDLQQWQPIRVVWPNP